MKVLVALKEHTNAVKKKSFNSFVGKQLVKSV